MNAVAALPLLVAVPMLVAGGLVGVHLTRQARQIVALVVLTGVLTASGMLLWTVRDGAVLVHHLGVWPDGLSIPFVVDALSALMLTVTALLSLVVTVYATRSGAGSEPFFAPLVLVLVAGVNGALMTADLFNLFVFVEIMLLPSYALILLAHRGRGRLAQVTSARIYVTVNLLTATVFLAGIALLYAAIGRVDLGSLRGAAEHSPTALIGALLVLCALAIKAAVFPAHGWLGRTYPAMSPTMSALFSALHTKVAVYAIFRLYALFFTDRGLGWVAGTIFGVSMIVGVLGALGEKDARAVLSFHMVSQIGYVLLGLALFTTASLAAGIFYLVHNMIAKGSLFLSVSAIELRYGRRPLGELRGLLWREPATGIAFLAAAVSLAGLPPFSGFVAKLAIITSAFTAGQWAAGIVALGVSLFTLMSMLKIWGLSFLGDPNPPLREHEGSRIGALIVPAAALAVVSLVLGVAGQPLLALSGTAASGLLDPSTYVSAVTGR